MDIEAYISSGKLEAYLAGELDAEESQGVEHMVEQYPEIRERLDFLRDSEKNLPHNLPKGSAENKAQAPNQGEENKKATTTKTLNAIYYWKALAISCAVFSIGVASIYYVNTHRTSKRLDSLQQYNETMLVQLGKSRDIILQQRQYLDLMQNSAVEKIILMVDDPDKEGYILLFHNVENNDIWASARGLHNAPEDKQYQLWTRKEGEWISMGILQDDDYMLQKMNTIENAGTYLLSLEPFGGSRKPTMEQVLIKSDG